MSRKRHYERFTNRTFPQPPPGVESHVWFAPDDGMAERNWETILSSLEQARTEYMRALRADPEMRRDVDRFTVDDLWNDGETVELSAYELDDFIRAVQQQLGLPQMPEEP